VHSVLRLPILDHPALVDGTGCRQERGRALDSLHDSLDGRPPFLLVRLGFGSVELDRVEVDDEAVIVVAVHEQSAVFLQEEPEFRLVINDSHSNGDAGAY